MQWIIQRALDKTTDKLAQVTAAINTINSQLGCRQSYFYIDQLIKYKKEKAHLEHKITTISQKLISIR